MFMTEGEMGLEALFIGNSVKYEPKKVIRELQKSRRWSLEVPSMIYKIIIPDFFLSDYNGYCEVISTRQSFDQRYDKLRLCLGQGYKFTFYDGKGKKIMFTTKRLNQLGLTTNEDLFTIKELNYGKSTLSGASFDCNSLYPEHIPKINKTLERRRTRNYLKKTVKYLYFTERMLQRNIAEKLDISQAFVSKLILEQA